MQIPDAETPPYRFEAVYRLVMEDLATAESAPSAFRYRSAGRSARRSADGFRMLSAAGL
ncbi:MAG: hypothetical protein WCI74_15350 [Actinomycetes bacterium]